MTALAGVCLAASMLIKGYDLNVGLETEQGLIAGKKVKVKASMRDLLRLRKLL